ncbi:CD48 antigen-like [Megalobrama amblycephala]|uniref:CD48 antigen-like n=1 Tax=Megalobrama amblycephala TaxID=75352 RepID=UPI00201453E4|nr:CD48 antigen-like [Megalobrama amblycephala]
MFVTMAVDHLLTSFILLLISNTGFSAEISVFVQTGDSVQLDIQTHELPEFNILFWTNEKSENIVTYIHGVKVNPHSSYKDRMDFNDETFSLTLKNMQKTDSGLYRARTSGVSEKNIVTYRVSVIDAVEAPVLTVNSIWSSSDSCTVNFTCRAHDLTINSSYQNNRCSPEEVTSHEIYTLILYCSEESIICKHSNPVSWKKDRINIKQLCEENKRLLIPTSYSSSHIHVLIIVFGVVGVIVFSGLVLFCCCMYKGVKQSDDSDYDDVETLTQKMTGDTWTTIIYCTVGHQTPSSAHDC